MLRKRMKLALALSLLLSPALALAQERPGDDYENVCTTTYNTTYTHRYMGWASCWTYAGTSGWQMLQQYVPLTYNSQVWINQFTSAGWLSCYAQVPYFDTITTTTPVTTCTKQPRQPFMNLSRESGYCSDDPDNIIGELYWSPQAGDQHEVQWRYLDQTQFQAYWSGSGSSLSYSIPKTRRIEYRMRTTRSGATGSWAYNTPRCIRERDER